MVFPGSRLVFHVSRPVYMVFHGSSLDFHISRLVFMVFHGSRLVYHGFSWFPAVFSWFQVGFSIVLHGTRLCFMVPGPFPWFCIVPGYGSRLVFQGSWLVFMVF